MSEYENHNSRFYELFAPIALCTITIKIGFLTIDTPRDSDKLCNLLQSQTTTTTLLTLSST